MNKSVLSYEDNVYFQKSGLTADGKVSFHNKNLLIGRNGSGKTRFLKALEAYYRDVPPDNETVVTLYYPEIDRHVEEELTISLYDAVFSEQRLSFLDFLQVASRDSVSMIEDLYTSLSMRAVNTRKKFHTKFKKLNQYLLDAVGRELCEPVDRKMIEMIRYNKDGTQRKLAVEEAIREFSPGERILFYLGIFIFYLEQLPDKEVILLIDEPELHLHPKALIALMELLTKSSAISQLWVASHSLFIMPQFPFEQIIHFDESHIRPLNRNTYKSIYDDLVGLENIDVYELLKSVENWAYYQFVVECFFLPKSVSTVKKNDEQVCKLLSHIQEIQEHEPIKVLDYGAGQYRLWECLLQMLHEPEKRNQLLQYDAYEPYPRGKPPKGVTAYKSKADIKRGTYDVVVLMNVLHEIDPTEWQDTFQLIASLLKENGALVFLEVHSLTNGEQPYGQAGFLLLQDTQVFKLFPNATVVNNDSNREDKSNCWVIPRDDLINITTKDICAAIRSLEECCEHQLQVLDKARVEMAQKPQKNNELTVHLAARKYAFLSQQYINAHLAYKRFYEPAEQYEKVGAMTKMPFPGGTRKK